MVRVHEDTAGADESRDLAVEVREGFPVQPVQGRRGQDGVVRVVRVVRQLRRPVGVLEVGGDQTDPVVAREGALGDGEERRVEVDTGAGGVREAGEQPGGDAARAAGEVEDARGGAAGPSSPARRASRRWPS
ncbi:hypothetical protein GCM10010228_62300 [Streptomyces massasporeus]|nr:hypothetical protein GCM10010228_62300 [Streptomyces massasporeus]